MKRFSANQKMRLRLAGGGGYALALALAAGLAMPGAADAQTGNAAPRADDNPQSASDEASGQIREIVVTARKRDESIQLVPIAITALSSEQLQTQRIFEVQKLSEVTPGLIAAGSKNRGFPVIRGITTRQPQVGADGAVGQYIDEVYQPRFSNQNTALLDLERVEVLRGPQGTLFGRNTIAGAINYVTRKPGETLHAYAEAGMGNRDLIEFRGSVSGPISSKLFAGVSVSANRDDGNVDVIDTSGRKIGDDGNNNFGIRGALRWVPDDRFELNISLSRIDTRGATTEVTEGNPSGPTATPLARSGLFIPSTFVADYRDYKTALTTAGTLRRKADQLTVRADWELSDDIALTSLSAFEHFNFYSLFDGDNEVKPIANQISYEKSDTYSQELRLSGNHDIFRWTIGGNYFRDDHKRFETTDLTGGLIAPPFNVRVIQDTKAKTTSAAVFGQVYVSPIDDLTLSGGIRYTHDKRNYRKIYVAGHPAFGTSYDSATIPTWDTRPSYSGVSYVGSVDYQVGDNALLYVSHSKGYRSGGIQGRATTVVTASFNYGPEKLYQYEVGAKLKLFNNHLLFNIAAYHIDYKDVQASQTSITQFFGGQVIQNAAAAKVDGVEIESKLQIVDQLRLDFNYTYNDTRFTDYKSSDNIAQTIAAFPTCATFPTAFGCNTGDYIFDDVAFEFSPRHSISAALNFEQQLSNGGTVALRGEYNWRSKYYLNLLPQTFVARGDAFLASKFLEQPGFGLLNAFASYTLPNGRWKVSLWANNITNKRYLSLGSDPRTVGTNAFSKFELGNRRTYGANVSWQF